MGHKELTEENRESWLRPLPPNADLRAVLFSLVHAWWVHFGGYASHKWVVQQALEAGAQWVTARKAEEAIDDLVRLGCLRQAEPGLYRLVKPFDERGGVPHPSSGLDLCL